MTLALDCIRLCRSLPASTENRIIAGQLMRSATSVAANYRASRRARSKREFIAKTGLVIEESDETLFWLELLKELGVANPATLDRLHRESNELTSIFVIVRLQARRRMKADQRRG